MHRKTHVGTVKAGRSTQTRGHAAKRLLAGKTHGIHRVGLNPTPPHSFDDQKLPTHLLKPTEAAATLPTHNIKTLCDK